VTRSRAYAVTRLCQRTTPCTKSKMPCGYRPVNRMCSTPLRARPAPNPTTRRHMAGIPRVPGPSVVPARIPRREPLDHTPKHPHPQLMDRVIETAGARCSMPTVPRPRDGVGS
jgi:hypothetical protein